MQDRWFNIVAEAKERIYTNMSLNRTLKVSNLVIALQRKDF